MLRPCTLHKALGLTRMQVEKVNSRKGSHRLEEERLYSNLNLSNSKHFFPIIKRLSPLEMEERQKKGLCYNCDKNLHSATSIESINYI